MEPRPESAPTTRGIGVLAGVGAFGAVGVIDGAVALVRSPTGSVALPLAPLVVLHCVAMLLTLGFAWGLFGEALLAAARRVPALRRLGRWVADGPRRWFEPDPPAAHGVVNAALAATIVVGPVFPAALILVTKLHSQPLIALALMLWVAAAIGLAGVAAVLAAPALAWALRRAGRLGSPGAVALIIVAVLALQSVRFCAINWTWMRPLDWGAASVGGGLLAANALLVALLGAWRLRLGRPVRRRRLGMVALVAVAAFTASALTFGARQTVASAIFHRSVVSRYLALGFQRVTDLDRDGYSAAFNGGDCNDRDPHVHPGALDVPGNGVDENCSGIDAVAHSEDGDGAFGAVPQEYAAARPSFVLLSIDAMRPDHMGAYGYRRPTTPNLDAFAQGAARFLNAYCASPRSLRSFASIWTGRHASQLDWGGDQLFPSLEPSNATLAEALRDAGYAVAMFNNADYFGRTRGFLQGFTETHEGTGFKDEVWPFVDAAASWVRERASRDEPFFLWIHLMEPHDPYRDLSEPREFGHGLVDRYDEELARADLAARRVLEAADAFAAQRPDRPLVVVVMGDHGEGHGEHGVWHHSFDLHQEAVRVPLLVRGPGFAPGPRRALASLMDLQPTFLNLAGVQPPAPVAARSLVPALVDPATPYVGGSWRSHLYAEVTPDGVYPVEQKALLAPPLKLIWDMHRGTWELFDIERDPREVRNLYDSSTADAARMRARLLGWIEGTGAGRNATVIDAARLRTPPAPRRPLSVRFEDVVELLGVDPPEGPVAVGELLRVTLYYRVLRRTSDPYWMNLTFVPEDGAPVTPHFHARHYPIQGRYPTTHWVPGEVIRDEVTLQVQREVRPVRFRMRFAVEGDAPGSRLEPSTGAGRDRAIELGPLDITPAVMR